MSGSRRVRCDLIVDGRRGRSSSRSEYSSTSWDISTLGLGGVELYCVECTRY